VLTIEPEPPSPSPRDREAPLLAVA